MWWHENTTSVPGVPSMSKPCTKCGVVKPLGGFHRDKTKAGGRRPDCKECVLECRRRYREENRDKVLECDRRYYEENREKVLDRHRRYYEENSDKVLERDRRYREENRDILNQGRKMRQAQYMRTSNLLASKKGVPYSPQEDAFLMADNGMNVYQKAIELGRTYASVAVRKQRLRARANH